MSECVEDGLSKRRHALEGQATPFVVNYDMVDTDKDGKISQAEFQDGCAKGWIQKADASTIKDMKSDKAQ